MEIDIRDPKVDMIDTIRVSDTHNDWANCAVLTTLGRPPEDSIVYLQECVYDAEEVQVIVDEEHARNLIKGIEKTIELGWFK